MEVDITFWVVQLQDTIKYIPRVLENRTQQMCYQLESIAFSSHQSAFSHTILFILTKYIPLCTISLEKLLFNEYRNMFFQFCN